MTKILWFSRHAMTLAQRQDLINKFGNIHVDQVSGSPANVHVPFEATMPEEGETQANYLLGEQPPLKELVQGYDIVAVVLPINMMQQLIPFAQGKVIQAVNARIIGDGGKAIFQHVKWQYVEEIRIVVRDL